MHRQSPRCRNCWLKSHQRPENYLARNCQKCGAEFVVHKVHVERGNAKYCSRSCARSGSPARKKVRVPLRCKTCNARVDRTPSEVKKSKGKEGFCGPGCWYSFNRRDNHYLWAGGQHDRMNPEGVRWRRAVLKRDKGHCRLCHETRRLEAHHILPFVSHPAERWEVSNGLTLCHGCHVKFRNREMEHVEALQFIAGIPLVVWRI
jgi:5-methylcytosine-specific restriction endonuclease McrA